LRQIFNRRVLVYTPLRDLCLESTKSWEYLMNRFIWNTKFWSQVPTLLQAKMVQQGKHMRVGAREGFPYHSVTLVLLANGNRYEADPNTLLPSAKGLYLIQELPCLNYDLIFLTPIRICSLWSQKMLL
jgi:hypothetical protein